MPAHWSWLSAETSVELGNQNTCHFHLTWVSSQPSCWIPRLCIPGNCSRSAMVFLHLLLQVTNCHFNHILFIKEITKFPLDGRASKNVWSCSEITHVFLGFGWIFSINLTSKSLVFSYVMPNLLSNPSNVYFILCFPFLQFPFVFLIFSGMLFIFPNVLFNISMIVI